MAGLRLWLRRSQVSQSRLSQAMAGCTTRRAIARPLAVAIENPIDQARDFVNHVHAVNVGPVPTGRSNGQRCFGRWEPALRLLQFIRQRHPGFH